LPKYEDEKINDVKYIAREFIFVGLFENDKPVEGTLNHNW
jgi:hypothetical protein